MKPIPARLLALALLLPPAALAQDPQKAYDVRIKWKPAAGHKMEQEESESQNMKMVIRQGDQVLNEINQKKAKSFGAVVEVLRVDGEKVAESKWAFSKATRQEEGETVPYGFQGKTVKAVLKADGSHEFTYADGSRPAEEDLPALEEAVSDKDKKDGKPGGEELIAPKKPVKVGETWKPSVKDVVDAMFEPEMAGAVDLEKSKIEFTLKSVESRGGAEFGKIEGLMELVFAQMGPVKLDKPLPLRVAATLEICIDQKVPDGRLQMKMDMKGASPVTVPNAGLLTLEMEMTGDNRKTRKTVR